MARSCGALVGRFDVILFASMRFEHLIEINDPGLPHVQPFSREQLWTGLMLRVSEPQQFPLGPDRIDCEPSGDEAGQVKRTLHFGGIQVTDTVHARAGEAVVFVPDPHGDSTPVKLTITIEEPAPATLILRFIYESMEPPSEEESFYDGFRQSAWLENDRDMVRTLRQWLAEGRLGGPDGRQVGCAAE